VTIAFDAIESRFRELRDFVLNDLNLLLGSPRGGNYAAALLIATACEALGHLRYESGGGSKFFEEYMLPENWRPVSDSLFNALRNGLAHRFAPKVLLQVNSGPIELGISWREKPHLRCDQEKGCVYLNITNMAQSLALAFEAYDSQLREDPVFRDRFDQRWGKGRVVEVQDATERHAWRQLLSHNSASQPTPASGRG